MAEEERIVARSWIGRCNAAGCSEPAEAVLYGSISGWGTFRVMACGKHEAEAGILIRQVAQEVTFHG